MKTKRNTKRKKRVTIKTMERTKKVAEKKRLGKAQQRMMNRKNEAQPKKHHQQKEEEKQLGLA